MNLSNMKPYKAHGFTLIELITSLAILAILLVACVSGFSYIKQKNALRVRKDAILSALNLAKKKALFQAFPVILAKHAYCEDFPCGMILFIDKNKNNQYDEQDEIIHQWQWDKQSVKVDWVGFSSNQYIRFVSQLMSSHASGHFTLYSRFSKQKAHVITLNRLGRIRDLNSN